MGKTLANGKRLLLEVMPGNLKNSHLYIRGHYDFFPPDCVGGAKKSARAPQGIEIFLDGLGETVATDIGTDAKTGKPRGFFRGRAWVRRFYEHHGVQAGAVVALDRLSHRKYRLSVQAEEEPPRGPLTAAEFFAGIGLVRLALERQGWQVVFANDIDPDKAEMYRHNWPLDDHLLLGDIHAINADEVPACDLFTASFPCNDLSIAGRWEGLSGKESSAFWGLVRILRELGDRRPPLVMLENVVGFLMSHGGRDFEQALLALNECGYTVNALILNAVHCTPQSRARLFVVCQRDEGQDCRSFAFTSDARPQALFRFINSHQNIRWNIRDLPRLPKPNKGLADIVEDLPDNHPHWWNRKRTEYFMNQMSERHEIDAKRMINREPGMYRRRIGSGSYLPPRRSTTCAD